MIVSGRGGYRRRGSSVLRLAVTALLILGAAGCGDDDDEASESATAAAQANGEAPDVVRFGIAGPEYYTYPVHDITRGIGAFEEVEQRFGTEIEFVTFDSGPNGQAALVGGSIDFLLSSATGSISAAVSGQDFDVIFPMTRGTQLLLVAPKDREERGDGIDAVPAFDGDAWGIISIGGSVEVLARSIAETAGIDWTDQNVIATGSVPASAAAVQAGRVDLAFVDPITAATLTEADHAYVVLSLTDPEVQATALPGFRIGTSVVARPAFLEDYPELSTAIVAAELQGLQAAREVSPDEAFELYPQEFRDTVPANVFRAAWPVVQAGFHDTGLMPEEDVNGMLEYQIAADAVEPGTVLPEGLFDDSLVREAYDLLGMPVPESDE